MAFPHPKGGHPEIGKLAKIGRVPAVPVLAKPRSTANAQRKLQQQKNVKLSPLQRLSYGSSSVLSFDANNSLAEAGVALVLDVGI